MRHVLLVTAAALTVSACNQDSVSLTNATPEQVAKATQNESLKMKAGQWETTVEMLETEMPGVPKEVAAAMRKSAVQTHSYCVTPEEADKPGSGLFTGDSKSKCTVEKFTLAGGKIDQTIACAGADGKPAMRMTTSGSYSADTVTATADMDMGGVMRMKAKISSRRTGECKSKS